MDTFTKEFRTELWLQSDEGHKLLSKCLGFNKIPDVLALSNFIFFLNPCVLYRKFCPYVFDSFTLESIKFGLFHSYLISRKVFFLIIVENYFPLKKKSLL